MKLGGGAAPANTWVNSIWSNTGSLLQVVYAYMWIQGVGAMKSPEMNQVVRALIRLLCMGK
jgi:hypothetical protein